VKFAPGALYFQDPCDRVCGEGVVRRCDRDVVVKMLVRFAQGVFYSIGGFWQGTSLGKSCRKCDQMFRCISPADLREGSVGAPRFFGGKCRALERCGQRFLRLPVRSLSQPDGLAEELPQGLRIRYVTGVFFTYPSNHLSCDGSMG
jgi:hypothetical protein